MEVMIMPLSAISRVEPVTGPTVINTYTKDDENSPFFHNFTGSPKRGNPKYNRSLNYKTQNQIEFMERSVQDYLGRHLSFYA
jgi:hypothetical protein